MKYKFLWYRIKTVRQDLFYLFLLAFCSIFLLEFWLFNIPEPKAFTVASELGEIYYKICFAYITAFIFYFLNVHLQSHKSKVKTFSYIENKIRKLHSCRLNLIIALRNAVGEPHKDYNLPSKEEINIMCKKIIPYNPLVYGQLNLTYTDWYEFFKFLDDETSENIKDLLILKDNLDSEIIRLLTNLDSCVESRLNLTKGLPLGNESLETFSGDIYKYCVIVNELISYLDKNYSVYKKEYYFLELKRDKSRSK